MIHVVDGHYAHKWDVSSKSIFHFSPIEGSNKLHMAQRSSVEQVTPGKGT